MKRKQFTEEQIIAVLQEHEAGAKTADLARKHGVSEATLYMRYTLRYRLYDIWGPQYAQARTLPRQEERLLRSIDDRPCRKMARKTEADP